MMVGQSKLMKQLLPNNLFQALQQLDKYFLEDHLIILNLALNVSQNHNYAVINF